MQRLVWFILFFLFIVTPIEGQSIRCYQCLAPKDAVELSTYCNDKAYCTGTYCFKGPDTTSTGIVYGCVNTPPIDSKVGICKVYNASSLKENCYCKNQDYCNSSPAVLWLLPIFLTSILAITV